MVCFVISGVIKRKHEKEMLELRDLVAKRVKEHSIYKGKAIKLFTGDEGQIKLESPPKFLGNLGVTQENLIFPTTLTREINAQIFTPIRATHVMRANGSKIKRGVLLTGPYGCGKSMTATATANACVKNGWTYIYLDDVRGIAEAVKFARRYQPALVFAEDVDRIFDSGKRTSDVDKVLNNIDGIENKSEEIVVIFTTNHPEKIHKAMMRPGRLDSILHIGPPDAETCTRMLKYYAGNDIEPNADLTDAGKTLEGMIPACIADTVTRARLYSVSEGVTDGSLTVSSINNAAEEVRRQHETVAALNASPDLSPGQRIGEALNEIVIDSSNARNHKNKIEKTLQVTADKILKELQ